MARPTKRYVGSWQSAWVFDSVKSSWSVATRPGTRWCCCGSTRRRAGPLWRRFWSVSARTVNKANRFARPFVACGRAWIVRTVGCTQTQTALRVHLGCSPSLICAEANADAPTYQVGNNVISISRRKVKYKRGLHISWRCRGSSGFSESAGALFEESLGCSGRCLMHVSLCRLLASLD